MGRKCSEPMDNGKALNNTCALLLVIRLDRAAQEVTCTGDVPVSVCLHVLNTCDRISATSCIGEGYFEMLICLLWRTPCLTTFGAELHHCALSVLEFPCDVLGQRQAAGRDDAQTKDRHR